MLDRETAKAAAKKRWEKYPERECPECGKKHRCVRSAGVAQSGEHLTRNEKVAGSTPATSLKSAPKPVEPFRKETQVERFLKESEGKKKG